MVYTRLNTISDSRFIYMALKSYIFFDLIIILLYQIFTLHQICTKMAGQSQYRDILSDFSEDELVTNQYTIHTTDQNSSSSHTSIEASNPMTENSLCIRMSFYTKESIVSYIKQYHIDNGYRFVVVDNKSEKF